MLAMMNIRAARTPGRQERHNAAVPASRKHEAVLIDMGMKYPHLPASARFPEIHPAAESSAMKTGIAAEILERDALNVALDESEFDDMTGSQSFRPKKAYHYGDEK